MIRVAVIVPLYISNPILMDYLGYLLESVKTKHSVNIVLVQNYISPELQSAYLDLVYTYSKKFPAISSINTQGEQSVSKGWNAGIKEAKTLGSTFCVVANLDIIFHPNCIDNLINTLVSSGAQYVSGHAIEDLDKFDKLVKTNETSGEVNAALFAVGNDFVDLTGGFDENFQPIYFEDWDMFIRMNRLGIEAIRDDDAWFHHKGSQTLKTDSEFNKLHDARFLKNQQRFLEKWGVMTLDYTSSFKYPFNDSSIKIKDWKTR